MIWRGLPVKEEFHATEDRQEVRDEVYAYLAAQKDIRVDVTLLDKPKAQPQTRGSRERFYKTAWFYHFKHVGPQILDGHTETQITAAAIGTKKGQAVFTSAVNDVMQQVVTRQQWKTFFPRSVAEPCLQIADYFAWAVQRKWERQDKRAYDVVCHHITTEYDLWKLGTKRHY